MTTKTDLVCKHCQDDIKDKKVFISDNIFCCSGCAQVYQILSNSDLCEFYNIDVLAGNKINYEFRKEKFDFLDIKENREKFVKFSNGIKTHCLFSIPQIHCSSCLWLLERLYKIDENIISSEVYFDKKEVYIVFDESKLKLKELVSILSSIGYEPSLNFEVESDIQVQSQRRNILRIGISGFCFANIMMLSLPEYFATGSLFSQAFQSVIPYILFALSLPVVFFTATEFYFSAFKSLKKGIVNIDLPVSLAVILTFIRSIYEVSHGISNGYFDSMTGIVFFMLIGRWLQNRTQNSLQFSRDFSSYFPISVERMKENKVEIVPIHTIDIHDKIKIYNQEIIPVDAMLSRGEAVIDYSFVNGESTPVAVSIGELIYAGGRQINGSIELVVMKKHSQSQLTSLWNHYSFSQSKEKDQTQWTDTLGNYFTIVVLGLSAIAGLYWFSLGQTARMFNAISTVLIVACPCALLLTSNFTYGKILSVLSQYKIHFKNSQILEKLTKINHVIFDKTGTLTYNDEQQVYYEGKELGNIIKSAIASLLTQSSHTLSKTILRFIQPKHIAKLDNYKEEIGKGIEGWVEDRHIKLGSDNYCHLENSTDKTHVNLMIDNQLIGVFYFQNVYRNGLSGLMKSIQNSYQVSILSGDGDSEYQNLRKIIYPENKILFHQSPKQKLEYVESIQNRGYHTLMIGDGLNDAGAFQVSDVSIALTEKNNFFNPASDVIMDSSMLTKLNLLIEFISKARKIILIGFVYSLIYNVIGLYYALSGVLSPVVAAILMPISSISLILFIHFMTEYYHHKILKK